MGRELHLGKFDISKERYIYLKSFCLLYPQWKKNGNYGVSGVQYDGMPHSLSNSSPTEIQALKNAKYAANIVLVENACKEASLPIWRFVLKNVTEGVTYENMRVPCGRRQFYEARRRVFEYLDMRLP